MAQTNTDAVLGILALLALAALAGLLEAPRRVLAPLQDAPMPSGELTTEAAIARVDQGLNEASQEAFEETGEHTFRQGSTEIGDTGTTESATQDLIAGSLRVSRGETTETETVTDDIQVTGTEPVSESEEQDIQAVEELKLSRF